MIQLPEWAVPNQVTPTLIDQGFFQRPALGARTTRIERQGNRYAATFGFPPMPPERSRIVVSRLLRAKSEGIRIEWPLLVAQGSPGSSASPGGGPMVDGAGQSGKTLALRGLTPHHALREGFWLTLSDENGARYLHNCGGDVAAGADGRATIALDTALRHPFLDGASVELAAPTIDGFVTGESWEWEIPTDHLIALSVPIEEWG